MKTLSPVTRRSLLQWSLRGGAVLATRSLLAGTEEMPSAPIVATTAGKVRGISRDGVNAFKGIPYGASTAGANRFMPPQKPEPWTNVRDALVYGPMAVQKGYAGNATPEMRALRKGYLTPEGHESSEDCLVLNVWTPSVSSRSRLPVMVWCHGGAFTFGMGDTDWSEGTHLASRQNVVVVSLNHRLDIFGFLYLAELGSPAFKSSTNLAMLDIIAALGWVRDNIARFGGDPGNVTVFGCSGGGNKISTLMAMPAAHGLFHKAIIESGAYLRAISREAGTEAAREVLKQLNIPGSQVERLQAVPVSELLDVMPAIATGDFMSPVVDGRTLPRHPFDPDAPPISRDVPMMIGTTLDEARFMGLARTALFELDETGLRTQVIALGVAAADAGKFIETYRKMLPGDASASDIYFAIASDMWLRMDSITQAERKSEQPGTAPVYMYLFARGAPSRYKAGHTVEIPFVFDNLDLAPGVRGPTLDPRDAALARQVSAAWAAFARGGNPNHPGLEQWRPYEIKERATMVLDRSSHLINDPRKAGRLLWVGKT